MTQKLLPDDFDALVSQAVDVFWHSRSKGSETQGGTRGGVLDGKNLDGFLGVVSAVARHAGIPESSVFTSGRTQLTLPGFYRPAKNWDVVIVHRRRLVAVLEFKSQVGSFGNNFNNRTEEAIGNASDMLVATSKGAYHPARHKLPLAGADADDPRAPFLGYLMLLEDCERSTRAVRAGSPHYHLLPEFEGASYAERYRLLCEKLIEQGLYRSASLILSAPPAPGEPSRVRALSPATDVRTLFTELAAQLMAAAQA